MIKGGIPTDLKYMAIKRDILDKEVIEERKRNNRVDEIINETFDEVDPDKKLNELREYAKSRKLNMVSSHEMSISQQMIQFAGGNNVFCNYKKN